jgi:hypothetical protein
MPRRRKPAGLECLVELARKAEILEQELSTQREAIERLVEKSTRFGTGHEPPDTTARPTTSSPSSYPGTAR